MSSITCSFTCVHIDGLVESTVMSSSPLAPLWLPTSLDGEFGLLFSSTTVTSLEDSLEELDRVEIALAEWDISNDSNKLLVEFCSDSSSPDNERRVENSSIADDSSGSIPDISALPSEQTMLWSAGCGCLQLRLNTWRRPRTGSLKVGLGRNQAMPLFLGAFTITIIFVGDIDLAPPNTSWVMICRKRVFTEFLTLRLSNSGWRAGIVSKYDSLGLIGVVPNSIKILRISGQISNACEIMSNIWSRLPTALMAYLSSLLLFRLSGRALTPFCCCKEREKNHFSFNIIASLFLQ